MYSPPIVKNRLLYHMLAKPNPRSNYFPEVFKYNVLNNISETTMFSTKKMYKSYNQS